MFPIVTMHPADARRDNLEAVARTLEQSQVPFFVVRKDGGTRTALGVPSTSRDAAVRAVRSRLADAGFYCIIVGDDDPDRRARLLASVADDELTEVRILRLWRLFGAPTGTLIYGRIYACDIEFWAESAEHQDHLVAPEPNALSSSIPSEDMAELVDDPESGWPMPAVFLQRTPSDIGFKIDAVYTWVDDSDPAWLERKAVAAMAQGAHYHRAATGEERFRSRDELLYSLRSLEMYAPWINHVFVVTDAQIPGFLVSPSDGLTVIDHQQIAPPDTELPVFNSNAIIGWLHRIPGLAEHYIYLNDDMFFGRDVRPDQFFTPSGLAQVFPSRNRRPLGPPDPLDEPHVNLTRNIRALLMSEFGRTISRAIKHTPYPQLRSVHLEMEERFRAAYKRTSQSRFRHHEDIVADQLFHYYALLTGRAVEGRLSYDYVNIGDVAYLQVLETLLARRDRDVFCLNDAPTPGSVSIPEQSVATFLDLYFPISSRWERSPSPLPRGGRGA